jgi:hypothetical protein
VRSISRNVYVVPACTLGPQRTGLCAVLNAYMSEDQSDELPPDEQVVKAATALTRYYGDDALRIARELERRLPHSAFAARVRALIETQLPTGRD